MAESSFRWLCRVRDVGRIQRPERPISNFGQVRNSLYTLLAARRGSLGQIREAKMVPGNNR